MSIEHHTELDHKKSTFIQSEQTNIRKKRNKSNPRIRLWSIFSSGAIALFLVLVLRITGIIVTVVITLFFALIKHERYILIAKLSILDRDLL